MKTKTMGVLKKEGESVSINRTAAVPYHGSLEPTNASGDISDFAIAQALIMWISKDSP